jgi:hypothetical protein
MDFVEAWYWLSDHPINKYETKTQTGHTLTWDMGMYQLDIHVVRVNPKTKKIEDNDELNTETNVWLEFGRFTNYTAEFPDLPEKWERMHDPNLDTGGKTFEEAIINLARLVKKHYGSYRDQ